METLDSEFGDIIQLKNNTKRANIILFVMGAVCVINVISFISLYLDYKLLLDTEAGYEIDHGEILTAYTRQFRITLVHIAISIASIIFFLSWFRRAYGNVHRISNENSTYHRTMAIWSFFTPILSLFIPFQIAAQIRRGIKATLKKTSPQYKPKGSAFIIGFWWILFIATNSYRQIVSVVLSDATGTSELILKAQLEMASIPITILAAFSTIIMIYQLSKDEQELYNTYTSIDRQNHQLKDIEEKTIGLV